MAKNEVGKPVARSNDLAMTFVVKKDSPAGEEGTVAVVANRSVEERPVVEASEEMLSAAQLEVMELLRQGKSITLAASVTRTSRSTIYYWLDHEPVFQAVYQRCVERSLKASGIRVGILTEKAVDVIDVALSRTHVGAAVQLLRGAGMLGRK